MKRNYEILRIIFLFVAGVTMTVGYLFTELNDNLLRTKAKIKNNQAEALKTMILDISKDARDEGSSNVVTMNTEIQMAYGSDRSRLEEDMVNFFNGTGSNTPLNDIMYKYTKHETFNIKNDNNDPFVVTIEYRLVNGEYIPFLKINADYSINCISQHPRTMEEEGVKQWVKGLYRAAIEDAVFDGTSMTIWHFLPENPGVPWYSEIQNMKFADIDTIIDIYKKHDNNLESISKFEFLQAIPILDEFDLLGNPRILPGSILNTKTMMMFYFYNFNFKDQLTCYPEHDLKLKSYQKELDDADSDALKTKRAYVLILIINVILVIFFAELIHKKHKEAEEIEKKASKSEKDDNN